MAIGNHLPNLDKIFKDDEEIDFLPTSGTNLAAIFGIRVNKQDIDSCTKHVFEKKPSAECDTTQSIQSKVEVIMATVVHAFKLQNNEYVSAGKLGLALTGNMYTKTYQIILYRNSQEHVSICTVTSNFFYIVQHNNYASYYDVSNQNWSILFESNEISLKFAREVGLARYFVRRGDKEDMIYQDLTAVKKRAKEGDVVCIEYFIVRDIKQPFQNASPDMLTGSLEITKNDNWVRLFMGANKGLKRILFLPPSKQIFLGPGFPERKDIMLEIEITEVSRLRENSLSHKSTSIKKLSTSEIPKMDVLVLPQVPTSVGVVNAKAEHLECEKKDLLQDFIKETYPNMQRILNQSTDVPTPESGLQNFLVPTKTSSLEQFTEVHTQPHSIPQVGLPAIDTSLNLFMSEVRNANAEIKTEIYEMSVNVQKILDKFHVSEHEDLKTLVTNKETIETTLRTPHCINTLSNVRGHGALNDLNPVDQKDEREMAKDNDLDVHKVEGAKEHLVHANQESSLKVHELKLLLKSSNDALRKKAEDLQKMDELLTQYVKANAAMSETITKLITECNTLKIAEQKSIDDEDKKKKRGIKRIMNITYQVLMDKFVNESYSTNYIKCTIGNTIKTITFKILEEGNQLLSAENTDKNDTNYDNTENADAQ